MKKALSRTIFNKIALFLIGITTLSLTGCLDKDEDPIAQQPTSYVSFYHGSPVAPDLNILIDNQQINKAAFIYSDYSNFLSFKPGSVRVKFSPLNAVNPSVDTALTFQKDKFYSILVVDKAAAIDVLVLTDDSLVTPATGKSKVRFVNLSPDAPDVDVVTTGTGAADLFTDVAFKESTAFIEVASGSRNLQVKTSNGGTVLLPLPNVSLEAGRIYTFVLKGLVSAPAGNAKALNFQLLKVGA